MRNAKILFLLLWHCSLFAQLNGKYNFRHIDQKDGLLYSTIRGLDQDEKGFIWILSHNGLQRYDGFRFVNYPVVIGQSSFGVMHDSELCVDTLNHRIEVRKVDKVVSLNPSNNSITTWSLKDFMNQDSLRKPLLCKDEQQNEWLISENGTIQKRQQTGEPGMAFFNVSPGRVNRNTRILKDPSSGNIYLHAFNKFLIADVKVKKVYSSSDISPVHPLLVQLKKKYGNSIRIRYLMLDSYRNIWITTWTAYLLRYNLDDQILYSYSLNDIRKKQDADDQGDITTLVNACCEDRQKNIWFATDFAGLLLYDKEKDGFNFITSDEKIPNGLRYNFSINSIFQDRDDNIWLGTDRGISVFNPYRNYFQSIRHVDGELSSLPKHDITDVIETATGEILIASWGGGLSVYDHQLNFIRNNRFAGPIAYNLVWSLVQNDDGTIWAGAQEGFIHIYSPADHTITTIRPKEAGNSTIIKMVRDQNGNILLGLHNGRVILWKKNDETFYPYDDAGTSLHLPYASVIDMYVDKANKVWVTTATGLQQFDIEKRIFTHLYQPEKTDPVSGMMLNGIAEYKEGVLIVGSIFHGFYFFDITTSRFSQSSRFPELDHASVYAIRKDDHGDFWMTTDFQIYRMNPANDQLTSFLMDHSNINTAFYGTAFYAMRNGRWMTWTPAEVVCFDPVKIGEDSISQFRVRISGVKVNHQSILIDSFLDNKAPVILPYHKNFISIEFASLDFSNIRETQYDFRLVGLDKNWNSSTKLPFADYTDLKPGPYTFEVKADQGRGFSRVTSFAIIIQPPWWGTWWFRLLSFLILGHLVYFLIRRRIHSIRHEVDLKHQIVQTEMMALRSQMNPHFIFNCINSIDGMIQSNDKYRATMYLNKFAKLIRNVLDISKENKVPLYKDMETLQLYIDLELFRYQDKFSSHIETDEELMQQDYKVPPLIIQPYVENAIHHGLRNRPDHDGRLDISVHKVNEQIVYVIEDNGIGRKNNVDKEKRENGYGMQMSSERIRLFNNEEIASVSVTDLENNGQPTGTRVEVRLNIQ